ncbi:MAG: radical SAM peptide maturase [Bacteroides sp.]|nr:radical SAM peptide maturase [Bacteroides sp.]
MDNKTATFLVRSHNGNTYLYLGELREFVYLPNDKDLSDIKIRYYEELGLIKDQDPSFITHYSPELLKENLANLRHLVIEVTDGCNLRCKYCGYGELYSNYDARQNQKMSFDDFKAIFEYLKQLWDSPLNASHENTIAIGFYGGEPLLNFNLIHNVISYIESLNITNVSFIYTMTTNAMLLDRYMDYIVEKDFQMLISLDGNEYNDSYRVTSDGRPSFSTVERNVLALKNRYPDYFDSSVEFNAVLHNRNSVESIATYIWDTFGKVPRISDLNTNGVAPAKKDEFYAMFKNFYQSYDEAKNCEVLERGGKLKPDDRNMSSFLDASVSNTYQSYRDLFFSNDISYIPTGTCVPFDRKIFLTVNGKILPCEKIGQEISLGSVKDGKVEIDFEEVSSLYEESYNQVVERCPSCFQWKNCSLCMHYIPRINGKKSCDRYLNKDRYRSSYHSQYLSLLENNPKSFISAFIDIYKD